MRQFRAMMKKELFEQLKTHRLVVMLLLFVLTGVLSPALAKMTPWLLDLVSGDMTETGIQIGTLTVNALSSWTQYYKNMPMILLVFLVLFGGVMVSEYQHQTLIILLSKGLKRHNILLPKYVVLILIWTLGCLISFGITLAYTVYFWDNSIIQNQAFALFLFYLLGVWLISVLIGASVFCRSVSAVLLAVAACFGISYLAGLLPAVSDYVPTMLLGQMNLLTGTATCSDYLPAAVITLLLALFHVTAGVICFRKKGI